MPIRVRVYRSATDTVPMELNLNRLVEPNLAPPLPSGDDTAYDVYYFWWDDVVTPVSCAPAPVGPVQGYPPQLGDLWRNHAYVSYVAGALKPVDIVLNAKTPGTTCPIIVVAVPQNVDPHTAAPTNRIMGFIAV